MLPGTFWCSIVVRVIIFSRLLVVNVNSDYSILVRVPSAPSRGSPTLWSMMSNVPTRTTTTQMICIAIIMLLKIRNGSISVRYPDYLKNGLFFNIIRSVAISARLKVNTIMAEMRRAMRTTVFITIFMTLIG